jgi:hypothetical protein
MYASFGHEKNDAIFAYIHREYKNVSLNLIAFKNFLMRTKAVLKSWKLVLAQVVK